MLNAIRPATPKLAPAARPAQTPTRNKPQAPVSPFGRDAMAFGSAANGALAAVAKRLPTAEAMNRAATKLAEALVQAQKVAAAPASFDYRLRYDHTAAEVAADFGVDPAELIALNGWSGPEQPLSAGTPIRVPDTAATRAKAAEYGQPVAEEAAAPSTAPTATAEAVPADTPKTDSKVPGHISQYHPEGQDQAYNDATGVVNGSGVFQPGYAQCGATSSAIAMRAFGYGDDMTDAQLILAMGDVVGTDRVNGTGAWGMAEGFDNMPGFTGELNGPSANTDWIRGQLESGKQVIANGNYYAIAPHENWDVINANPDAGGHYVAVVGIAEDGRFMVQDPAYDNGGEPILLTDEQLTTFINANSNGGYQVAVGREN